MNVVLRDKISPRALLDLDAVALLPFAVMDVV